jgi:transcriptional antiterminator NusG
MKGRWDYSAGERVRIKSGPFQSFTARVETVDRDKGILKVLVEVFGRTQPIELRFLDIEKIKATEEE